MYTERLGKYLTRSVWGCETRYISIIVSFSLLQCHIEVSIRDRIKSEPS
jgi:hypothetical protein